MKYPNIIFFRHSDYSFIDDFFIKNKENLLCNVNIINNSYHLNKLFNCNNHLLITYGIEEKEYIEEVNKIITPRINHRWIHMTKIEDVDTFNNSINYCYMHNITKLQDMTRPVFSLFTTCFNSYDKIIRAYKSIKNQTFRDWEWVILDDSTDEDHFTFLKNNFKRENKIRLYKRSENSGSIGNVKNEAVSLCRGKYVLEMDHDDEIVPDCLLDSVNVFEKDKSVGFIYMNYSNVYENGDNFNYGNHFGLGYSGYYREKYNNKWLYVAVNPNINNVTLSHIVSIPNHPRIWKRSVLLALGNYSEFLPISDDYELFLRTAVNTKITKINKLGYIQYMNNNSDNFSLIRNSEINRLRVHITNHGYINYDVDNIMKYKNAFEPFDSSQIWKRENYEHFYCNDHINVNYKMQYCIIGLETLHKNQNIVKTYYENETNDFIVLDNIAPDDLCQELDNLQFSRMKCYGMTDCSDKELINYFHLMYRSCDNYFIFERNFIFE
jgi:glycosyltransferase involved in cell wall biosynthesis